MNSKGFIKLLMKDPKVRAAYLFILPSLILIVVFNVRNIYL